jgi:HIV Tat-specific factor 1
VYVTGLPDDTDVDEVAQHFARCGIIKLDDAGQPRIKLYKWVQRCSLLGLLCCAPCTAVCAWVVG